MKFKKAQRVFNNHILERVVELDSRTQKRDDEMTVQIAGLVTENNNALKAHATRGLLIQTLINRIDQLEFSWVDHVEPKKPKRGKRATEIPKRKNT